MGIEGDGEPAIVKALQLDCGFPHQYKDVGWKLIDEKRGEFFLLQPHPLSFDSRYFGPVLRCDIVGVARPLWTWNPPG